MHKLVKASFLAIFDSFLFETNGLCFNLFEAEVSSVISSYSPILQFDSVASARIDRLALTERSRAIYIFSRDILFFFLFSGDRIRVYTNA